MKRKQREQERRARNRRRLRRQDAAGRVYLDGKVYLASDVEIRIGDATIASRANKEKP